MKKTELRRIEILKRVLNGSVANSLAKAFRSIGHGTLGKSNSQDYSKEPNETYVRYDEQAGVRLRLLELERQRTEAIDFARRHAYG